MLTTIELMLLQSCTPLVACFQIEEPFNAVLIREESEPEYESESQVGRGSSDTSFLGARGIGCFTLRKVAAV